MPDDVLPEITVFTPTYNRAEKLKRAYESLKNQTDKDFVWLIVDDGSTDDTEDVVRGFIGEGLVDIKYIHQENGGKMRAHNRGVVECVTKLFICLDSDDQLTEDAVEEIVKAWAPVAGDESYAGIIAYKGQCTDDGSIEPIYGNIFPVDEDCSFRELYRKGFRGETTLVFRTELLRRDLFPEIEGEKYVPEDVVYDRIDEGHIFKLMPKILTICELMEEGYTDRVEELRKEAPTGWFIYYHQRALSEPVSVLKLKYAAHYLRFRERVDEKYRKQYRLPLKVAVSGIPGYAALALRGKL